MYLPVIQGQNPEAKKIDVFGGLNRSFMAQDNEFSDMENMTGEDFPHLSVRQQRKAIENFTEDGESLDLIIEDYNRQDAYDKGTGIRIYDKTFDYYERGEKVEVQQKAEINNGPSLPIHNDIRGLVRFGNNVICYPRPEVLNIPSNETRQCICLGCFSGDKVFGESPLQYNTFTFSKSDSIYEINVYRGRYGIEESYRYLYYDLKKGDRIKLIECRKRDDVLTPTGYDFGDAFFVVEDAGEDSNFNFVWCKMRGYRKDGTKLEDDINYEIVGYDNNNRTVLIVKVLVDANLLAVHQNRLWGTDTLGTSLYCSNATDFYDWNIDGTAAGGGYLDVPENTPWTAICEYGGYLYAFKANRLYKVMGSNSLDYSIIQLCDIGCTNHEAVAVCDSVLYFLSRDGVYAFTGSQPVLVSEALPGEYKSGHFAGRGQKLYASVEHIDGRKEFLVYDTGKRLWHKEDDFSVRSFVDYSDGLYALGEDRVCYKLEGGMAESDIPFSVTTKKYFYTFDKKAVSSVRLFLDMGEESQVTVAVSYDGGGFEDCGTFTNRRMKYIPIRLRQCDEFQFKISGRGFIRLKKLEFVLHTKGIDRR